MTGSTNIKTTQTPPSLMKSLKAGFDAISNHVSILFFSISIDLFLWFGPRLRLSNVLQPYLQSVQSLSDIQTPEIFSNLRGFIEELNLFSALRTFPIGIPSLVAGRVVSETPISQPLEWEISSLGSGLILWIGLTVVGLCVGALFFLIVSQVVVSQKLNWGEVVARWPWAILQVTLLFLFWIGIIFVLTIPISCFLSILMVSGLGIEQISLLLVLLLGGTVLWLLFPLVFSPHGIFINQKSIWYSIVDSFRLTRSTLPATILLFAIIFVLSEGLDMLWSLPQGKSWMMIAGVGGHAFVSSSLLAASFIYYRDVYAWIKNLSQQVKPYLA